MITGLSNKNLTDIQKLVTGVLLDNEPSSKNYCPVNRNISVELVVFVPHDTNHDKVNMTQIALQEFLLPLTEKYQRLFTVLVLNGQSYYDLPGCKKRPVIDLLIRRGVIIPLRLKNEHEVELLESLENTAA